MTIWHIVNFSGHRAPHWDTAYIEAKTEEEARSILLARMKSGDHETVWGDGEDADPSEWHVKPAVRPLLFVLGGGCR